MSEKKIGDREFKVSDVLATDVIRMKFRLGNALKGGFDGLADTLGGLSPNSTEEEKRSKNKELLRALADILGEIDPDVGSELVKDICEFALVKVQKSGSFENVVFDAHFTNRTSDIYPVAAFVLKEMFSELFSGFQASGILPRQVTE